MPGRILLRRVALALGAVLVLLLVSVAVLLWSSTVHSALAGRAFAALEQSLGIIGHADSVDLDLARLDIRLGGLSLATRAYPDEPFFTVDDVAVEVPWSAVWGELAVDVVALVNPRLSVYTGADGSSNLPETSESTDEPEAPARETRVPVGAFAVRDFTMRWVDERQGLSVDVGRTTIDLSGDRSRISGPIGLSGQVEVMQGDLQLLLTELQGQLWFDGVNLGIDELGIAGPDGAVTASGQVDNLLGELAVDLDFESDLSVASLADRFGVSPAAGRLGLAGGITLVGGAPAVTVSLSSDRVVWSAAELRSLTGQVRFEDETVQVDGLSMGVAEGAVQMSGSFGLAAGGASALDASWVSLDGDALLTSAGLEVPVAIGRSLTGDLELGWTDLDPRSTTIRFRNRGSAPDRSGTIDVTGRAGTYTASIDQGFGRAVRVTGTLQGVADSSEWSEVAVVGDLAIVCADLEVCRPDLLAVLPPGPAVEALSQLGGRALVNLRLDGTVSALNADGRFEGVASQIAGLAPIEAAADFSANASAVDISTVDVRLGENRLRGEVAVRLDGGPLSGRFDAELDELTAFTSLMPEGVAPSSGRARLVLSLGGSLDAPSVDLVELTGMVGIEPLWAGTPEEIPVRAVIDLEGSAQLLPSASVALQLGSEELWWGDIRVGRVGADVTYDDGEAAAGVGIEEFGVSGRVEVELTEGRPFSGEVRVASDQSVPSVASLSRLGRALDLPLAGDLSLEATFAGSLDALADTTAHASMMLSGGRFGEADVSFRPSAPTFRYAPDRVAVDEFDLIVGESTLRLGGLLSRDGAGTLTARFQAEADHLLRLASAIPATEASLTDLDVSGSLTADASVTGWIDAPRVSGQLDFLGARVAYAEHPPVDDLELRVRYEPAGVEIDRLTATWQGTTVTGTGRIPARFWSGAAPPGDGAPAASVQLRLDPVTQDTLAGYLAEETLAEIDGTMTAVVDIEASEPSLEGLTGSVTLEQGAVTLSGVSLAQRRPTRVDLVGGQLTIAAFDWGNDLEYLTLGGTVDLADEPVADLTTTGSVDLLALSAFTSGVGVEGQADLIANIRGPISDLDVTGTIELVDAGIRVAEPRLVVAELNGAFVLTRDTLTPFGLRGELNGGPLEISGELRRSGLQPQGRLTLSGRQIAMNVPQGLRTELDADISVIFEEDDIRIAGTTVVTRGAYREPMSLTGGLLSAVDSRQQVTMVGLDEPSLLDTIQLDIQVSTAEDIVLDNNYLDAALAGDVRLGGTLGAPALTGRVALLEGGRIRMGTRSYDIESGAIDLIDPTGIEPQLDIRARTRVTDYDITLTITGGQDDLETSFESDPPLPERDILSVLLSGQTLSETASDPGAGARDQALGLVSSELLGSAGRELGLDVQVGQDTASSGLVRFDSSLIAGEVDPSTRLTVAKRLSDRVQLILSQDLRGSGLSWIVSYLARNSLEMRGLLNDDNDRAYELRHGLEFGAPPQSERLRSSLATERPALRIDTLEFSGTPGYGVDALRDVVRQRVGNTFDFHRWQEDQDRLQRFYSDEGFFEVRIRARRNQSDEAGTIGLVYEIDRGPRTRLVVEGYELPRSVRRELELAWELSVFAAFLVDELEAITQSHLRTEGFLEAQVEVDVVTSDDAEEKMATVRISPGSRIRNRELSFAGNQSVDDRTLVAFANAVFDDTSEWGSPQLLEDALVRLYQANGMLEATVAVRPIEVDGAVARLPVDITEGRQFTIVTVDLVGVEARTESDARAVMAVEPGTPYSDLTIQEAITRLELSYRQRGFNSARVSAESSADTDNATVSLTVTVREGRQEILEDVVVAGASRTHPGLVSSVLDLELGQPVDLTDWNLARKRLYDTGVFRTVDIAAESTGPAEGNIDRIRARVLLEEWPLYNLQYGLRVNDLNPEIGNGRDFGLGFAADASRRNLLGRGAIVGTAYRAGNRGQAGRGYINTPRSFGLPVRSSMFVERSRAQRGEDGGGFTEDLTTFSVEQRLEVARDTRLIYSTNFDRNHSFEEVPANADFPFDITLNIIRFSGNLVLDRRDNLFDATQGWFHSSHVEYGFQPGEGQISFTKFLTQQYQHWSPRPSVVVATGVRLGVATGLGDSLIPSERFFAGGGNTVRGYGQDSLGPTSFFDGLAAGGNSMLILNQELRFPLLWRLRGVGFVDAGNVFATSKELSLANLEVGTGFGLRVDTPVGLLRFDYAFALTRDDGDPTGRFHFSFGQAF